MTDASHLAARIGATLEEWQWAMLHFGADLLPAVGDPNPTIPRTPRLRRPGRRFACAFGTKSTRGTARRRGAIRRDPRPIRPAHALRPRRARDRRRRSCGSPIRARAPGVRRGTEPALRAASPWVRRAAPRSVRCGSAASTARSVSTARSKSWAFSRPAELSGSAARTRPTSVPPLRPAARRRAGDVAESACADPARGDRVRRADPHRHPVRRFRLPCRDV